MHLGYSWYSYSYITPTAMSRVFYFLPYPSCKPKPIQFPFLLLLVLHCDTRKHILSWRLLGPRLERTCFCHEKMMEDSPSASKATQGQPMPPG